MEDNQASHMIDFKGLVCITIGDTNTLEMLVDLLGIENKSQHHGINCYNIDLKNKYYSTTVHLFDYNQIATKENKEEILQECHSIILFADSLVSIDKLNGIHSLHHSDIDGGPTVLLYRDIDRNSEHYRTLLNWSISNDYELILTADDDCKEQLIDSISAYGGWVEVDHKVPKTPHNSQTNGSHDSTGEGSDPQLDEDLLKKMTNFDQLLQKLSAYRDAPEMRGNPNDKNIEEIAELLSGLLGEDNDNFLGEDDEVDS